MRAPYFDLELDVVKGRRQTLHSGHGIGAKGNTGLIPAHEDALDPQRGAHQPQKSLEEERFRGRWEHPKTVAYFRLERVDLDWVRSSA